MQFLYMSCTASRATIRTFKVTQNKLATHLSSQLLKHQGLPSQHQLSRQISLHMATALRRTHFWCVTNRSKSYKLLPLFTSNCIPAMLQKTRPWQEACVSRCVAPFLLLPAISSLPRYVFIPDFPLPICKTDSHGNPSLNFSGHTHSLFSSLISLHLYLRCSNLLPSSQKCPALISIFSGPLLAPHLSLVILTTSVKENFLRGSFFYNPGKGLEAQFWAVRQMEM